MQKWYLVFVLAFGTMLIGCLGDDVTVETKPRLILQPPYVKFKVQGASDLMAQWGPSLTDTQTNFKGYYVELYSSVSVDSKSDLDSVIQLVATGHAPKSDTFFVFKNITPGRYTLYVFGERESDPSNPDSIFRSTLGTTISFTFDPTPVVAPTQLFAHSVRQGVIDLKWDPSASNKQPGMAGYIVRFRDNSTTDSKIYTWARPGNKGDTSIIVDNIQLPVTSLGEELEYKLWVKGVRNDSTESADSVVIFWSGARELGLNRPTIENGKRIFIGQANLGYEIKQADGDPAQIGVTWADSTVTLTAFMGAKFANRIDTSVGDQIFFPAPFPGSAFSETTITLPRNPPSDVWVYVLFAQGARARVIFYQDGSSISLIHNDNKVHTAAKFQPGGPPFFLTYF